MKKTFLFFKTGFNRKILDSQFSFAMKPVVKKEGFVFPDNSNKESTKTLKLNHKSNHRPHLNMPSLPSIFYFSYTKIFFF